MPRRSCAPLPMVRVNCGNRLSTAHVFAQTQTSGSAAPQQGDSGMMEWVREQRDNLQAGALAAVPEIAQTIRALGD